jgi:hypothetical protein
MDVQVSGWRLGKVLEMDEEQSILWLEPWPDPDCHPLTNKPLDVRGVPEARGEGSGSLDGQVGNGSLTWQLVGWQWVP